MFYHLTQDLERCNDGLDLKLSEIDGHLTEQLKNREALRASQARLYHDILPGHLHPLIDDASNLEHSLQEAAIVAEKVSKRVREIDVVRTRAVETIQKTNEVINLKNCVQGIQSALTSQNYDLAVQHMAVYLKYSNAKLPLDIRRVMSAAETQLLTALRDQLNIAITSNNVAAITRYTQLFAPLGLFDEGVSHYASYLEKQINTDLSVIMTQVEESKKTAETKNSGEKASYASALSQLIQRAHARLKRAKPILEAAFGPAGLIHTVLILQPTLATRCTTLLDDFMKTWQNMTPQLHLMAQRNAEVERYEASFSHSLFAQTHAPAAAVSPWNPMDFSPLLDQLVIICQTIEVNSRFTAAVINQARDAISKTSKASSTEHFGPPQKLPSNPALSRSNSDVSADVANHAASRSSPSADQPSPAPESDSLQMKSSLIDESQKIETAKQKIETYAKQLEGAAQFGPLTERLVELLGFYMRFEQYYLKQSIAAVISQDSINEEARSTALVDDIFFILKEASNRAMATYNANTLCAVTNYIDAELNSTYYLVLQGRSSREALQHSRAAALGGASSHGGAQSSTARNVLLSINQLEQTAGYIARLKTDFEETSKKVFALLPHELEKILTSCEELPRTESKYKLLIIQQIEQVFDAMKPRFEALFDVLTHANYNLSESEYNQNQINGPVAVHLVQDVAESVTPIQQVLTPTNASLFLQFIMRFFIRQLERAVVKKQFTQLGAEQLDRDLGVFLDYFSKYTPKGTSRDSFTRLTQIASLLSGYSLEEIQDEWNSRITNHRDPDRPAWALAANDAKRILSLRVDFSKDAIAKLHLL